MSAAVGGVAPKLALPLSVPLPVAYVPVALVTVQVPASTASVWLVNVSVALPVISSVPLRPVSVRRKVTGTGDCVSGPPKVSSSVVCPLSASAPEMAKVPTDVVWPVSDDWMAMRTSPPVGSVVPSQPAARRATRRLMHSLQDYRLK